MIFQFPSFLWALGALLIPILIHLFNFRKTTQIYFSNTRFLKQVKQETTQKRKIKQYLILAARLLFVFFLVMAFAQPFLPAAEQVGSQKNVAIYIDNSLSMSAPVAEKKRAIDEASERVREIVTALPPDVKYQLITNDFASFSNSFKAKSEVEDELSRLRLSSISRNAQEIESRILDEANTLFWISDFQSATFGSVSKTDSSLLIKLVPIKTSKLSNVLVDTVYLENPSITKGEKNTIHVRLRNVGDRSVEGLVTKLFINSVQASAASINIEPNSTNSLVFDLPTNLNGLNKAVLSFSDYPVSFDNEFYFTLNLTTKLKVIEIKSVKEVTPVERVFGNKELFTFDSFQAANLNYSLLNDVDLIIVNQLEKIELPLLTTLNGLRKNHSILLIPALLPDEDSYQQLIRGAVKINKQEQPLSLALPDFKAPLFQNVFEEINSAMAMPVATKVLDWGSDRSAILTFKDGRPFLSQVNDLFVLACPLIKSTTDFYAHALFVPVMYRLASLGSRNQERLYHSLSSTIFSFEGDSLVGEVPIKMIGKQEVIPAQHRIGSRIILELPKFLLERGFYSLVNQKDTLNLVAFNLIKDESMLENLKPEEIKLRLGGSASISIFNAGSTDAFRNEIKERYLGTPLWKYAIVLALVFLLAEILLIRFLK
jgi:hypothetical protein